MHVRVCAKFYQFQLFVTSLHQVYEYCFDSTSHLAPGYRFQNLHFELMCQAEKHGS